MELAEARAFVEEHYQIKEWRNATGVLTQKFPDEWEDIMQVLAEFRLYKGHIDKGGGNKSKVAALIDSAFVSRGWRETKFDTKIRVEEYAFELQQVLTKRGKPRTSKGQPLLKRLPLLKNDDTTQSPTHQVDDYKNKVGVEVEWNNKDPFYDRDLNNFRLLFELRVISAGVIITRADELQERFKKLGRGKSYGASTTHMSKLLPKIDGGGGGGCPILVFGIKDSLYVQTAGPHIEARNEED